jgi:uncharacterized repeat protein (TIGR03803 family)
MTAKIFSISASLILIVIASLMVTSPVAAQTFTVLFTFTNVSQGFEPWGPLALDAAGNIYGTAFYGGGASNYGTVFKVDTGGTLSVLHSFTGIPDGFWPQGGLVVDKSGQFVFGATPRGGNKSKLCSGACGTIFRLTQAGEEKMIYRFGRMNKQFGAFPQFGLSGDANPNIYGSATFGGPDDTGVIFRVAKGAYTVLYTFTGARGNGDGTYPQGPVIPDSAGNLYGTTGYGGAFGYGTVFKIDPTGKETVLYSFTGGIDGGQPQYNLVLDSAGNLYGTTVSSQFLSGGGTIFRLDPNGNLKVLYTFPRLLNEERASGLVMDAAGNLYGTTGVLGTGGILFKLSPSGTFTALHTFTGGADGGGPSQLVMDTAGNLYGATATGGNLNCNPIGCGVIFKLTP